MHKEIILPENAPHEFHDRQTLWNFVEQAEKRCDARTAREIVVALPREFTFETQTSLVRDFVTNCFVAYGMCADLAIHRGDSKDTHLVEADHMNIHPHNPHAHILLTTRLVGSNGFNDKKNRDWDKKEYLIEWREKWADIQNKLFQRKGLEARVSHESYKKQGIDREPTKHLGPVLAALERERDIKTKLGNENRAIEARNKNRDEQKQRQRKQVHDRSHSLSR